MFLKILETAAFGGPAGGQTFEKFDKRVMGSDTVDQNPNPFVQIFKTCPSEERELVPRKGRRRQVVQIYMKHALSFPVQQNLHPADMAVETEFETAFPVA